MRTATDVAHLRQQRENLRRLYWMRNLFVAGVLAGIGLAHWRLGVRLPLTSLFSIVAMLAAFNAYTWLRLRHPAPVRDAEIVGQFWVDLTALISLLYFSGGATNPFISFFLPCLAVAAATLSGVQVWLLSGFALLGYSALVIEYIPLDIRDQGTAVLYHLAGMWINFVVGAIWIAWFVLRMSRALRDRDAALAEIRQRMLGDERVVALGAQAARVAHHLGTPLATIAIASGELRAAASRDIALADYLPEIQAIEAQVEQCRVALDLLHAEPGSPDQAVPVGQWLNDYFDDWLLRHPAIELERQVALIDDPRCGDAGLLGQILTILLDNAVRASRGAGRIDVSGSLTGGLLTLSIGDYGAGLPAELRPRIGKEPVPSRHGGRGWGLFLAASATLAQGGALTFSAEPPYGNVARLDWPLTDAAGSQRMSRVA